MVDIEGYVALNSNRYSVPVEWIGRRVEVRETKDKIEIQLDARRLATETRGPIRIPKSRPSSPPRRNWPTMPWG